MGRLDNKVAIITGASGGVGQVAAVVFAREGAKVVVASRNAEASEETVRMVREVSGEAMFHKTNVSNVEDVKNMVRTTIETYGKLDILYNNAAICIFEPLIESTEESFERMISTNLKGVWLSMKYSIPEMIKIGGGAIINTSSIVASAASRGSAIYAASKAGIGAMTRVAAVEYAAHNIRVNCIEPGAIATPMAVNVFKDIPGVMERIKRETPQGRLGKPEEIAQLALFLASDESSHITGETIVIDGGIQAHNHIV